MVDIARDARWGRVMEGSGEDTYLGSLIAAARVRGFQGKGIGHTDAVMACVKHFAAYGAATGGRDYNSVDMSLNTLWQYYLPPFKAAVDAGVGSVMNSFNTLNGIPATANTYLLRDILKGKWGFKGIVVSDWGSVNGIMKHGYAADNKEAAMDAIIAGCDMDMESRCYKDHLAALVKEGKVLLKLVDDAVRTILIKKFELGLFDDPYKFSNAEREQAQKNVPAHIAAARDLAKKSIVLLKNNDHLLPLAKNTKTIAMIGPFVKAVRDNLGFWSMEFPDDSATIVTQWQGVKNIISANTELLYAKGCNINDTDTSGFAEAIEIAKRSDIVIMSMGEARDMSGEARSRSNLHLPGVQEALINAIHSAGKKIVLMMNAGRPLVFDKPAAQADAILYTWWLGSQAGNAIGDILSGAYNPSGKLPISFPRTEGQEPIYYNHLNTGHAAPSDTINFYVTGYIDLRNSPAYPFGYGLSYTSFSYGNINLDKNTMKPGGKITASIAVTNTGNTDGEETVQLYIRDIAASIARPVKELKSFQKIFFKEGEMKTVTFTLTTEDLKFYNNELKYVAEPGDFKLFIGTNSDIVKETDFKLIK
jgi:beta-glucosidase